MTNWSVIPTVALSLPLERRTKLALQDLTPFLFLIPAPALSYPLEAETRGRPCYSLKKTSCNFYRGLPPLSSILLSAIKYGVPRSLVSPDLPRSPGSPVSPDLLLNTQLVSLVRPLFDFLTPSLF